MTKILEGGVQRAGNRVRINVQLIDAATDAHVWAESYDRELVAANVFAIQSEIATAVARALEASLTAAERTRVSAIPTQSLQAWEDYQLGKQKMGTRNSKALNEAETRFRSAISRDPDFALAWTGLADTLALQTFYAGRPTQAGLHDAEQALARALALDPLQAEGWATSGNIAYLRQQFERAEEMLRRAITLNPNYATAYIWLANALTGLSRREEAVAAAERAVSLDPWSAMVNIKLGDARAGVGRYDDALAAYRQAIMIDPTMALAYYQVGEVLVFEFGRLGDAVPWYEKAVELDSGFPDAMATMADLYWQLGDDAVAAQWMARSLAIDKASGYSRSVAAVFYLDRGDMESARKYAQEAAERDAWRVFHLRDLDFLTNGYAAARSRYASAFPELFAHDVPPLRGQDAVAAIDLALVLQHTGESRQASALLDRSEAHFRTLPRMGLQSIGIGDVQVLALRGKKSLALTRLREAEQAGWRFGWRYARYHDPLLASIRNEPEFKAVFADIERDMAQQRAAPGRASKGCAA